MKIITGPSVHLLSAPQFFKHPKYELPPHSVAAENIIATGGKVCYDSYGVDGRSVPEHIAGLVGSGHHSVIEHVHVGVFIEGISRGCSHEIVRHRMFNYSQRSTRYTAEDDAAIVLDPYYADIYLRSNESADCVTVVEREMLEKFVFGCRDSFAGYSHTIKLMTGMSEDSREQQGIPLNPRDFRKWCRGKARQLLPHALETRMLMTGNLRAWRHFFLMRTSRHAEAEIRRLADAIWTIVEPIAPTVFADLVRGDVDGYVELTAPSGEPDAAAMLAWAMEYVASTEKPSPTRFLIHWIDDELDEHFTEGTDYRDAIRKAMRECAAIDQLDGDVELTEAPRS